MNYKRRQALSIGLGISSAIGTVVSMILAIQETPKALAKIKEIKEKDNPKKIDYVKGLFPIYWPSFTVCAATVLSTTMSQLISLKTEASLIATTAMIIFLVSIVFSPYGQSSYSRMLRLPKHRKTSFRQHQGYSLFRRDGWLFPRYRFRQIPVPKPVDLPIP